MRAAPTLGLALISKNEEASLPRLLASVTGAFDRVVLVDTGSSDRTVEVFETWARGEVEAGRLDSYAVDHFKWCDDFSAARNHADSLLSDVDWLCWADCDDEIRGARNLRGVLAAVEPNVASYLADYDYGGVRSRTTRLVRRGHGRWVRRLHEFQEVDESCRRVLAPTVAEWVHHQDPARGDVRQETRLRICRKWARESPEDLHAHCLLAREELAHGETSAALDAFARFFELLPPPTLDDELAVAEGRIWMLRYYAHSLAVAGRLEEALGVARSAFLSAPSAPEHPLTLACLALAETHYARAELHEAAMWVTEVLERERPTSGYIEIDDADYHERPLQILFSAVANMTGEPSVQAASAPGV